MADRTLTVGNGKTYASLQAAITAQRTYLNLTTDNGSGGPGKVYIDCYNLAAGAADTTAADTGTGWTTDANNYLIIRGAPSERSGSGTYSTSRYHLEVSNVNGLKIQAPYTQVLDIQVQQTCAGGTGAAAFSCWNAGAGFRMERCIAKGVLSGTITGSALGYYLPEGGDTAYIINCLAYDFINGTESHIGFVTDTTAGNTVRVYNCTAVNCYHGFEDWKGSAGNLYTTNCGASGCTVAFTYATQTTCSSTTPTFVNAAGDDFHLASGDTTWKNVGTDLSATFTTDVDWQNRPTGAGTWDIGFDEYVAASTRTVTIGPGKLYESLAAALAAEYAAWPNLTVNNGSGGAGILAFECYAMEEVVAAMITVPSFTVNSSNYLIIRGAASDKTGNTGKWSTNRYRLKGNNNIDILSIPCAYTRLEDLQIWSNIASTTATRLAVYVTGGECIFSRCIIRGTVTGTNSGEYRGVSISAGATTTTFQNCLFFGWKCGTENKGRGILCAISGALILIYNTTFYNCYYCLYQSSATFRAYNCGYSSCDYLYYGTLNQNVTNVDGSPTFVDSVNFDFHLDAADTVWKNQGTDESAVFTDDVDGQTRPTGAGTWDVGFDEYISAGGYTLAIENGLFLQTGQDVILSYSAKNIAIESGTFSLIGDPINISVTSKVVICDSGVFVVTGEAAGSYVDYIHVADSGSIVSTGNDVTLSKSIASIVCDSGAYSLTGQDAGTYLGSKCSCVGDAIVLTGYAVGLNYLANPTLFAETMPFVTTGQDAGLPHMNVIPCEIGSLYLVGNSVNLSYSRLMAIVAESGMFLCSGNDASLLHYANNNLVAGLGEYFTANPNEVVFPRTYRLIAESGDHLVSGDQIKFGGAAAGLNVNNAWFITRGRRG